VLQDRNYVRLEKRRFQTEDRGRLVTSFLVNFFERYVQYNFTADLENRLDDISGGRVEWKTVLRDFWTDFSQAIEGTRELRITQVIDTLDAALGPHFFPGRPDGGDARLCPVCNAGRLGLRLGKFGAFIGCSKYPECRYTRRLTVPQNGDGTENEPPRELGTDPVSGEIVSLRQGPYGPYAQLGTSTDKDKKPKRVSLPKGTESASVDLEKALALLALPKEIGQHPETQKPILVGIGRFGPYVKHETTYRSIGPDEDLFAIGLNRAVAMLAEAPARKQRDAGRSLGPHPEGEAPVTLHEGRYGPYLRHGRTIASLPRGADPAALTMDEAVVLLAAREAKGGGGRSRRAAKPTAKAKAKPKAKSKAKAKSKPKTKSKAKAKKKAKPDTATDASED